MAQILDPNGRPVTSADLRRRVAAGATSTVRNPFPQSSMTGLTPQMLIGVIRAAENRDHERYLEYAAEIEKRDAHYFSQLRTRKIAVSGLPRRVVAPDDSAQETAIAELLTGCVNSDGFSTVLKNVQDALGKGFSCTEIVWDTDVVVEGRQMWLPKSLHWVNPKFIKFDRESGEIPMLKTNENPDGEELSQYKYIYHRPNIVSGLPLANGLARQVAAMHLFKSFAVRDWMAFSEVFGLPIRIGTHPPNATPEDVDTLREAVRDIGADAAAVLPETMKIMFERAGMSGLAGSDEFFLTLADWLDSQVSKAVVGQTMTADNGSSLAQAEVHDLVRKDIRDDDIQELQDTLNRDFIRVIVDLNFGPRPRPQDYPRIDIYEEEEEDLQALANALTPFIDRGLPVEAAVILDKFGLELPDAGAVLLQPQGSGSESEDEEDDSDDEDTGSTAENVRLAGVIRRITAAAEKTTNMRHFKRELGELLRDV